MDVRAVPAGDRAGPQGVRLRRQPDLVLGRAREGGDVLSSYYDVRQAVVVRKGTPIASVRSIAGLRKYKLGAQIGTTSYGYIVNRIKPTQKPGAFPQNIGAINALKNGQIDAIVVDLPTAYIVTATQITNGKVLGQLPRVPGGEHFSA